jgi:enamine deaminase RidA (YjgF/YER057c/UK114 family)
LIAWEAVARSTRRTDSVVVDADAALMPAGARLFISGQAEKGTDVASAVKLTMAGLHRSLAHLGLTKADVVQVKAFVQPFAEHAAARREIAASFDGGPVPPAVIHEWVSELYTEIEMVVSARGLPPQKEPITYAWLPWLNKSNRYCNVTTVRGRHAFDLYRSHRRGRRGGWADTDEGDLLSGWVRRYSMRAAVIAISRRLRMCWLIRRRGPC